MQHCAWRDPRWARAAAGALLAACSAGFALSVDGCPSPAKTPYVVLLLNTSASNDLWPAAGDAADHKRSAAIRILVNTLIGQVQPGRLRVVTAGKHPLWLTEGTVGKHYSQVLADLTSEQLRLLTGSHMSPGETAATTYGGAAWGYGTDHASAFAEILRRRPPGRRLIIVGVTDGFNENWPWSTVSSSLAKLYAAGPATIIMLGLSPRTAEAAQQSVGATAGSSTSQSEYDVWDTMFKSLGAVDIATGSPNAPKGYYVSNGTSLPTSMTP